MDGGATIDRPHRFTVDDYYRMAAAGILHEDSRVELIKGQIVDMSPVGSPHHGMVNRLNRLLVPLVAGRGIVSVQNPVRLDDDSEPQPDIAILKPRADDYTTATARPDEVMLIIEVADSSLDYDRETKMPLYAENGIPEYWLVNLTSRVVEVHRLPQAGRYAQVHPVGPDGFLDILAFHGAGLPAEEVLRRDGS